MQNGRNKNKGTHSASTAVYSRTKRFPNYELHRIGSISITKHNKIPNYSRHTYSQGPATLISYLFGVLNISIVVLTIVECFRVPNFWEPVTSISGLFRLLYFTTAKHFSTTVLSMFGLRLFPYFSWIRQEMKEENPKSVRRIPIYLN